MRKFKYDGETDWTLASAASWLYELNRDYEEVDALADLQVGQTYVDSDGDTWARSE